MALTKQRLREQKPCDMRKSVAERGRVPIPPRTPELEARVLSKVEKQPDGCWLWTGELRSNGYGVCSYRRRKVSAHRVVYEWFVGPIPHDQVLDHTCRVRHCCNPAHLDVVTDAENRRRGESPLARAWRRWDEWERRGRCGRGHDLAVHLRRHPSNGARHCLQCHQEDKQSRRQANREKVRAYERSYYQRNKERILARKRDYYQRNKERILARKRARDAERR